MKVGVPKRRRSGDKELNRRNAELVKWADGGASGQHVMAGGIVVGSADAVDRCNLTFLIWPASEEKILRR